MTTPRPSVVCRRRHRHRRGQAHVTTRMCVRAATGEPIAPARWPPPVSPVSPLPRQSMRHVVRAALEGSREAVHGSAQGAERPHGVADVERWQEGADQAARAGDGGAQGLASRVAEVSQSPGCSEPIALAVPRLPCMWENCTERQHAFIIVVSTGRCRRPRQRWCMQQWPRILDIDFLCVLSPVLNQSPIIAVSPSPCVRSVPAALLT